MKNAHSYSDTVHILAFPHDESAWRVDWFGDIAYPDRSVRRRQPSVLIQLSKVLVENFEEDPAALLWRGSTAPTSLQKAVWISVGTLMLIRIGDIWRNGKLILRPDYELEELNGVQIDKQSTSIVKAGSNVVDGRYLIPIGEHPWHMRCTKSNCIVVKISEDRRVVIPCTELVRFYFGSSSPLLSTLFMPPLDMRALYSSAWRDPRSGKLRIDLADSMRGASAADIGRIAMDPIAGHAARIIGKSCLQASITGESAFPIAIFPFEGVTDLIASGKWLTHGDITPQFTFPNRANKSTFLVYNLRSCSHPFPFRSLQYTTAGAVDQQSLLHKDDKSLGSPNGNTGSSTDSKDLSLVEKDASNDLARKLKLIFESSRFPDLKNKYVWRSSVLSKNEGAFTGTRSGTPISEAAVGDSGSDRRIRPVDLAVVTKAPGWDINLVPVFLQSTVNELDKLSEVSVELLTDSQDDGWTVPISVLSDDDGEVNPKLMIAFESEQMRLRRVAIFALKRESRHICIVVIESEPPAHTMQYDTTGQNLEELWSRTLRCAADDFIGGALNEAIDSSVSELIRWDVA